MTANHSPIRNRRAAAVEAAHNARKAGLLTTTHTGIAERRGPQHRHRRGGPQQLTLVYYGLRDGHIRALDRAKAAA
jgi:hypothetical protein